MYDALQYYKGWWHRKSIKELKEEKILVEYLVQVTIAAAKRVLEYQMCVVCVWWKGDVQQEEELS